MRNLCITNTIFEGKPQHHVSYKHPQSHRGRQLGCPIRPTLSPAFSLYPLPPLLCHLTRHVRSSLIKLPPEDAACPTFSPLSVTTAPTAILIILWCTVESGCSQRNYKRRPPINNARTADSERQRKYPGVLEKASSTPWAKMPLPDGTSRGRPSSLRPCQPSAERRGPVTTGLTPVHRSWSPFLRSNDKPS